MQLALNSTGRKCVDCSSVAHESGGFDSIAAYAAFPLSTTVSREFHGAPMDSGSRGLGLLLAEGEQEQELRAFSDFAGDLDPAVVVFDNTTSER